MGRGQPSLEQPKAGTQGHLWKLIVSPVLCSGRQTLTHNGYLPVLDPPTKKFRQITKNILSRKQTSKFETSKFETWKFKVPSLKTSKFETSKFQTSKFSRFRRLRIFLTRINNQQPFFLLQDSITK